MAASRFGMNPREGGGDDGFTPFAHGPGRPSGADGSDGYGHGWSPVGAPQRQAPDEVAWRELQQVRRVADARAPVWEWLWVGPMADLRCRRVRFQFRKPLHWVAWALLALVLLIFGVGIGLGAFQIVDGIMDGPAATSADPATEIEPATREFLQLLDLALALLLTTVPAVTWAAVFHGGAVGIAHRLGLRTENALRDIGVGAAAAVGMVVFTWLVVMTYYTFVPAPTQAPLGELSWALVIGISLVAGIGEEVFVRGWLMPRVGVWTSSVFFALLHISYGTVPQLLLPFLLSFGFAWLTIRYRSLLPAIVAHVLFDLIQLSLSKTLMHGASGLAGSFAALMF